MQLVHAARALRAVTTREIVKFAFAGTSGWSYAASASSSS